MRERSRACDKSQRKYSAIHHVIPPGPLPKSNQINLSPFLYVHYDRHLVCTKKKILLPGMDIS